MSLVGIIIYAYNVASYIDGCIEPVLHKTVMILKYFFRMIS